MPKNNESPPPAYKIRPAARLIKTIGQDLIKDVYAAIVELVKNAYDADSPDVDITFSYDPKKSKLLIRVEDHGDGMNFDTVINKWLVPATDDKFKRKRSEKRRILQGRKGIGRFAAAILGERILLETTQDGVTTFFTLDMEALDNVEFLDQLALDVSKKITGKNNGTIINIEKENISPDGVKEIWTLKQLRKLLLELRSLISPEEVYKSAHKKGFKINYDPFKIKLIFGEFPLEEYSNREIKIRPFPVLDLYDYRISGTVTAKGKANLRFENQNIPGLPPEEMSLQMLLDTNNDRKYPGDIFIDLRVYDRDPDSIDNIIKRGLKDPDTGEYVGKKEARAILDEYYGVGIYRERFRIRPYGEPSFDWLDLDKKRVQNPSYNIGHNQVIGFIYVRSEEESGLTEKSARDGLMENKAYFGLISIISGCINELAGRRVKFRQKALKGGRNRTLDDEIVQLFDFDSVRKKIVRSLDDLGMSSKQRATVSDVVIEAFEVEKQKKSRVTSEIRDTIAIYQGQATLGKITHVLLHEGRKHIKYVSETIPRIVKWAKQLSACSDEELELRLEDRSNNVISHATGLSHLFKKIEPLARTRRSPKRKYDLKNILENTFAIFSSEMEELGIEHKIIIDLKDVSVLANEMDLITVFSNLIENSIFWLGHAKKRPRKIILHLYENDLDLIVEYKDTGPGFQGNNLSLMFEPGYSMKPEGTGLGLALAGEAMSRIGGRIEAKHSDQGAVFEILFKDHKNE